MTLPNGYKKIEYIQSSGSQYIDTGYKPNINTKLVYDAEILSYASSGVGTNGYFIGGASPTAKYPVFDFRYRTTSPYYYLVYRIYSNASSANYGGANMDMGGSSGGGENLRTVVQIDKNVLIKSLNRELNADSFINWNTSFSSQVNMSILGGYCYPNFGGSSSDDFMGISARLYSFQISDGNMLVRDFIPCIRISDNVVGLYDLQNNEFYTNKGSGTFIAGPVLPTIAGSISPNGAGTISGLGQYASGTQATLTATPNSEYEFVNWTENGTIVSSSSTYSFTVNANRNLVANFKIKYNISLEYDDTLGTASYSWGQGTIVNLSATPNANGQFKGWYIDDVKISDHLDFSYNVQQDTTFEARFTPKYSLTLDYDSESGSASFTRDSEEQNLIYLSVDTILTRFDGWYIGDTLISYNESTNYQISEDSVIEARFEPVWEINESVDGDGSIEIQRQSTQKNIVTFSVIPNEHWHFVKYEVDGEEYTRTPLTLTLTQDTDVIAYFEEDTKVHITVSSNIPNGSIYISNNDDFPTFESTLWARPYPHYNFKQWSDGVRDNPRTLEVSDNITLIAEYEHEIITNEIYQYRCYVKDQLRLTDPPKAYMVVKTFDLKEDLLTTANSNIEVYDLDENINNGDILVVYNPFGETIYQGIIYSMQDNKIGCHQMQNFYKGQWVYNVHPSSTLEQEIAWLLGQYAQGKIYKTSYTDPLVAQRLGGITIDYVGSTNVSLPTDLDKDGVEQLTQKDMEQFIYSLYQDYGICLIFEINWSGTNYVHIKVPTYGSVKVGNNNHAIKNLSPITTIEETNRLILYWSSTVEGQHTAKTYRTTYVATSTGIVEKPTSLVGRFNITNTKIVFSDDDVADLVAKNLPSTSFNHKITFSLLLKNSLYKFNEFALGMPLDIWYGTDYYGSVLTGWNIKKGANQNVSQIDFTCGLVRTALTKKLSLGVFNA